MEPREAIAPLPPTPVATPLVVTAREGGYDIHAAGGGPWLWCVIFSQLAGNVSEALVCHDNTDFFIITQMSGLERPHCNIEVQLKKTLFGFY